MKLYCTTCNTDLTIHADGTIACSCSLQRDGEPIPSGWVDEMNDAVESPTLANWREFEQIGA